MKTSIALLGLLTLTAAQFGKGKSKGSKGGLGKGKSGKGGGIAEMMAWYVRFDIDLQSKTL
jgi:hypothetical protein